MIFLFKKSWPSQSYAAAILKTSRFQSRLKAVTLFSAFYRVALLEFVAIFIYTPQQTQAAQKLENIKGLPLEK